MPKAISRLIHGYFLNHRYFLIHWYFLMRGILPERFSDTFVNASKMIAPMWGLVVLVACWVWHPPQRLIGDYFLVREFLQY